MDILKIDEIKKHKIDIIIVLAIFLLAFGIRMIPSETFPGVYGFDPFYHARVARTLIQDGYIPKTDPLAYWPDHAPFRNLYPPFYHYTLAGWYTWVALLNGLQGYHQNIFIPVNDSSSAFYAGLATIALFLWGLATRNRKAGLFSALLFIGWTDVLYRTMYGFTEEDPGGIFMYTLSFAMFAWMLKKKEPKYAWLAGITYGVFLLMWRMAIFPAAIMATYMLIEMIIDIWQKKFKDLETKAEMLVLMLIPMMTLDFLFDWTKSFGELTSTYLAAVTGLGILAVYWFKYRKSKDQGKIIFGKPKGTWYKYAAIATILIGLGILAVNGQFIINKVNGYLNAPYAGENTKLGRTVGENHPAGITGVLGSLGWTAAFFIVGLVWLPFRRWKRRKKNSVDLLVWLLAVVTAYLFVYQAKMGYIFDTPAALLVGVVLADLLKLPDWWKAKAKDVNAKWLAAAVVVIGLILGFIFITRGIVVLEQYKGNYAPQTGWIKAYDYLDSLPGHKNFVIMTWWDYGHWTAWWGLKTTLDNRNLNPKKVEKTAAIFTDFRGKTTDQILKRHEKQLKAWQVTHIGVDRILITCQKWGALTYLGNNMCIPASELKKWNISYPPILEGPQEGCPPGTVYAGCMQGVYCHLGYDQSGNKEVICPLGRTNLVFSPKQWDAMVNTKWPGYNLDLDTGNGVLKARVYARPDGYLMFFVDRMGRILPDAPANYMLGYRLFFQDPSIKAATLVGDFWGKINKPGYKYVPEEEVVFWKINYNKLDQMNETVSNSTSKV